MSRLDKLDVIIGQRMRLALSKRLRMRQLRKRLLWLADKLRFFFNRLGQAPNTIRRNIPGQDPLPDSKRAAVYVHFDRDGRIADYVVRQLRELVEAGFRITFVTNSPVFSTESEQAVFPFCQTVLWRNNVGYDFGAYKDGIEAVGPKDKLEGLLLMNDSVYGPFWKLSDVLLNIDPETTDFWGITDCWDGYHHIQSYFIFFLPAALNSMSFKRFWSDLPYINHKGWVIRNGEIKLSEVLIGNSLRANVLAPYRSVSKTVSDRLSSLDVKDLSHEHRAFLSGLQEFLAVGEPLNPMHYFWDVLILVYKCPFIKRELIKLNPVQIPDSWRWPEVIQACSDYDISMIRNHLQGSH